MKQIVLVKDIPTLTEIEVDPETHKPMIEGIKRQISEVDKSALETALKLKESMGGEIVTLSMGDDGTKTAILEALAMGADVAYIVNEPGFGWLDTNATSKVLEAAIKKIGDFDLILSGEMTLDSLSSQIGPRLAELLDLPLIAYVKKLSYSEGKIKTVKDLEDVDEIIEVKLPAIISVEREINEPRIPSIMNILRAKKKPQIMWTAGDLGLTVDEILAQSFIEILNVTSPEVKRKQIVIEAKSVEEAAEKLAEVIISEGIMK